MEKECTTCLVSKSLNNFYRQKISKDGYKNMCKDCCNKSTYTYIKNNRIKVNNWKKKAVARNREIVINHLQNNPCTDCGESDIIVLEFDHVTGKKINNISNMVTEQVSEIKLRDEITKCEVRCANCHRRITYKRLRTLVQK